MKQLYSSRIFLLCSLVLSHESMNLTWMKYLLFYWFTGKTLSELRRENCWNNKKTGKRLEIPLNTGNFFYGPIDQSMSLLEANQDCFICTYCIYMHVRSSSVQTPLHYTREATHTSFVVRLPTVIENTHVLDIS